MDDNLLPREPTLRVILVHGTFSRGAAWCKEGSTFRTYLRRQLGAESVIEAFEWSGWNLSGSRLLAAKALAHHILEGAQRGHQHILIGHSHGGNVIRYALRQEEILDCVKGVITLATPFLHAHPRNFEKLLNFIVSCLKVVAIILCFVFTYYIFAELLWAAKKHGVPNLAPIVLLPILVGTLLLWGVIFLSWVVPISWVVKRAIPILRSKQIHGLELLNTPPIKGLPILVCKAFADEADLLLNVARLAGEWVFAILSDKILIVVIFLVPLVAGSFLLTAYLVFDTGLVKLTKDALLPIADGVLYLFFGSLLFIPIVILVVLLSLLLFPYLTGLLGYGMNIALETCLLDLRATQKPIDWCPLEEHEVRFPIVFLNLRHSLMHENKGVATMCGRWIKQL
jgi:Alpha/beta hydrolase family